MIVLLSFVSPDRKIALFGGTFDPIHEGHLHLAALAKESLGLDEVRFIPCQISPHKQGTPPASAEDRLEMLRLATSNLPWAEVDDFELNLTSAPSYSYLTAEAMAQRFPSARLFWVMGYDQWEALPDWKYPARISACVEFLVLARGKPPQPRPGYRLHVLRGQHPASSSEIRAAISSGKSTPPWLPLNVRKWIQDRGLYQVSSTPEGGS